MSATETQTPTSETFEVRQVPEPPFAEGEPCDWAICDADGVVDRYETEAAAVEALHRYYTDA